MRVPPVTSSKRRGYAGLNEGRMKRSPLRPWEFAPEPIQRVALRCWDSLPRPLRRVLSSLSDVINPRHTTHR